jgi:hypothetical protein
VNIYIYINYVYQELKVDIKYTYEQVLRTTVNINPSKHAVHLNNISKLVLPQRKYKRLHYKDQLVNADYCVNHVKPINVTCRQKAELSNIKAGGTYNYHSVFKVFEMNCYN